MFRNPRRWEGSLAYISQELFYIIQEKSPRICDDNILANQSTKRVSGVVDTIVK